MVYVICECARVEDTLFCCRPVKLPDVELEAIYIGPRGVYAIAEETTHADPASIRTFLRHFFGTARIELYLREKGRYNVETMSTDSPLSEEALQQSIREHTQQGGFLLWHDDVLEKIAEKVRHEDARNRGIYRDREGIWYIARNGNFVPLSDKDPNRILRLTLFGGILGIHRFAMGKWCTGLVYLLTGGLIGLGWFMDLIQLALGAMTDRKKRLIPKPDPLSIPWYLAGFAASFVLFCVYALSTGVLSGMIAQISLKTAERIDPAQASALIRFLQSLSDR